MKMSMLYKWDYSKVGDVCYSDAKQESYKKAAQFLVDNVEDWGCGTGWAKRYFKHYKGVDGAPSIFVKQEDLVDLAEYTSDVENILMRQVLEFNWGWQKILENVKKSFREKFCLIVMTPLAKKTHFDSIDPVINGTGEAKEENNTPNIYFNKQDILDYFPKSEGYKTKDELVKVKRVWPHEWILYVEKITS